jgi:hypothetical protein
MERKPWANKRPRPEWLKRHNPYVGRTKYVCTKVGFAWEVGDPPRGRRMGEFLTMNAARNKQWEAQMHGERIRITEEVVTDPDWQPWTHV